MFPSNISTGISLPAAGLPKKCEARSHQCEADATLEVRLFFETRAAYNKLHFYMPGAVEI